jgi:hypothetical protein
MPLIEKQSATQSQDDEENNSIDILDQQELHKDKFATFSKKIIRKQNKQ